MPQRRKSEKRKPTPRGVSPLPQSERVAKRRAQEAAPGRTARKPNTTSAKKPAQRPAVQSHKAQAQKPQAPKPETVRRVASKTSDSDKTTYIPKHERTLQHARTGSRQSAPNRKETASQIGHGIKIVISVAVIVSIVYLILRVSPTFTITQVVADPTDHISQEEISDLTQVPSGSTLLNFDEDKVTSELKQNPWVDSVDYERDFPHTLTIHINERHIGALAVLNSGSAAWYIADDGTWIEPAQLDKSQGQTSEQAALALASSQQCVVIKNLPASVQPRSGSQANDETIDAVSTFQHDFSSDFAAQVVSYSANSTASLSCVLSNGVEVSLGSANNISEKETAIETILASHAGKVTYINVRIPSNPSYRSVDSDQIGQGSGTLGGQSQSTTNAAKPNNSSSDSSASASQSSGDSSSSSSGSGTQSGSSTARGSSDTSASQGSQA